MSRVLQNKTILLGVTGSIAAYKAAMIASQLTQAGARVDVVMTREATQFVGAMTFEALTHRHVVTDVMAMMPDSTIGHVAMAKRADAFVIAPVTAHTIAKLALGLADDAVSATALDTRAPLILAPAMESGMWEHPATQANVATLVARGAILVEPGTGHLASGLSGKGRMADVDDILDIVRATLGRTGDLAGRHIVVTAGGTQEAIDPVRVIANHSSGKMGFALAHAARDRGARVTLIAGVTSLRVPRGITHVSATSARDMRDEVMRAIADADALVMAAAVADFRPAQSAEQKIKKGATETLTLELIKNPDILNEVSNRNSQSAIRNLVVVGFAAETQDLIANARAKLEAKNLDLIVANPVPASFGGDLDQATFIERGGAINALPPMSKDDLAEKILDVVASHLQKESP
ncbi:MAG: bifunctional phosphopantothenoylcysteine decarboxylase/phosphopantothenate--cysteine ligase CoaBC [Chloroflexi bacterium]|nr:bifunctional phosphopantothenoylcysteine decarboxylase/phosphopantothenate--cysteine ligase CoaBC [Chloroflexota bacterium]